MKKKSKDVCAPNVISKNTFSCFTSFEIIQIANAFNEYLKTNSKLCKNNSSKCISTKPIQFKGKTIQVIWNLLYKKLSKLCKEEYCWIDLPFINSISNNKLKQKIKKYTFKPKMTKTKFEWLSTIDINDVLEQYDLKHKSFKFFGAYPSDFYKHMNFNYQDLLNYDSIAIVFNLDTYYESGSHWVSLYIDNKSKTCEYFDSVGNEPNVHISKFIKYIKRVVLSNHRLLVNKTVHQVKNTECGVYSIHYIIQRLNGKTFGQVCKTVIRDDDMNRFRNIIFRPRN